MLLTDSCGETANTFDPAAHVGEVAFLGKVSCRLCQSSQSLSMDVLRRPKVLLGELEHAT